MDELEESLKRLFQDSRLEMRVAPGAEEKVVAGARRVRRNRIALVSSAGALSLAVLAGGTFLLAQPGVGPDMTGVADQPTGDLPITSPEPTSSPTQQRSPASVTTEAPPSSTRADAPQATSRPVPAEPSATVVTFGPAGYSSIRLGMTEEQLLRTGSPEAMSAPAGTCSQYRFKNLPSKSVVTVSRRSGVVSIAVTVDGQTPEGIRIGSTEDNVRAVYRGLTAASGTSTAAVPGNTAAIYRFRFQSGKVTEMTLELKEHDCTSG